MEKKPAPRHRESTKPLPDVPLTVPAAPSTADESCAVTIHGKTYEIQPTRTKYFRTQWANGHVLLKHYTLSEIYALTKERDGLDGDETIFRFLVAAFDDEELVREIYDELDSQTLYRICEIFRKVNKIYEIEEHQKNLVAATKGN